MTFEREIYYILKEANKPMTTKEVVEAITTIYCGEQGLNYSDYIAKLEAWAEELKQQNLSIQQKVVNALHIITNHQYAKTWTTKEELGYYTGKNKFNEKSPKFKTYTFRYWQAIK